MGVGDIAEDTAGADRGKLLIITDQPDTRTATDGELDGRVEGEGVGHAGFVDDHQCRRADRGWPVGQWPCRNDQVSLARVSVGIPVCSARTAAAAAEGARPGTWPPSPVQARVRARMAVVSRRQRGRSPAADVPRSCTSGGRVRPAQHQEQCRSPPSPAEPGPPPAHRPLSRRGVPRRQRAAVRHQGPVASCRRRVGDGVDRQPVDPPQRSGFRDVVSRCGEGNTAAIEHLIDQQVD